MKLKVKNYWTDIQLYLSHRVAALSTKNGQFKDDLSDFYSPIVEYLESSMGHYKKYFYNTHEKVTVNDNS